MLHNIINIVYYKMLSIADVLILFGIIIGLIYIYFKNRWNYWKIRNVPYKEPVFPFGNVLDVARGKIHLGKFLTRLYNELEGPYFGMYGFTKPFLVIKDPDIIKRVLIKDFQSFPNRLGAVDEKIDPIVGNGLPGMRNPQWKALRTKLSSVFTSGKMKMMMHLMTECGENLQKYVETVLDSDVEMKEIAAKYTTDVITSCAFGINANSFLSEDSEFRTAGKKLLPSTPKKSLKVLAFLFVPQLVKIFRFSPLDSEAVQFLRSAFNETISKRETTKNRRNDLIDTLIELKNQETKDDEFKFYGDRLVAQAIIFFNAGHETTSSVIAFTLHELCINTNVQDKLRQEIKEVLKKHGELTYEALQDMKYLHMVVSETLRKYPVTPFLVRECIEDYKVPETGLVIEKGIHIYIPQDGLHWDPKYFPNPEKYDPERFNDENRSKLVPYVYLPFGDGPRNCIGERFGMMSSKLGIIYIIKNFRVEKNSQTENPLSFKTTMILQAKNGIHLTLRKLEA